MKAWALAHRWWMLGAALALALSAGAFLGYRSRKPAAQPPAITATQDVAQGLAGASQQHRMGKATARVSVKQLDPATGAVTGETDIDLGCEDDSSQEQAVSGNQAASQAVTVAPAPEAKPLPADWYRLSAGAAWNPARLQPTPDEVRLAAKVKAPWLPLWGGIEAKADPAHIKGTASVRATLDLEWP